jgi:hypothetical protein
MHPPSTLQLPLWFVVCVLTHLYNAAPLTHTPPCFGTPSAVRKAAPLTHTPTWNSEGSLASTRDGAASSASSRGPILTHAQPRCRRGRRRMGCTQRSCGASW